MSHCRKKNEWQKNGVFLSHQAWPHNDFLHFKTKLQLLHHTYLWPPILWHRQAHGPGLPWTKEKLKPRPTAVYSRSLERKKSKCFVFNKYFCLILGELKSKISKKSFKGFLRKLDFKLFHYKTSTVGVGDRLSQK